MNTDFSHLNLHPELVQAVVERGYTTPTPIQTKMIPVMLTGHPTQFTNMANSTT